MSSPLEARVWTARAIGSNGSIARNAARIAPPLFAAAISASTPARASYRASGSTHAGPGKQFAGFRACSFQRAAKLDRIAADAGWLCRQERHVDPDAGPHCARARQPEFISDIGLISALCRHSFIV